MTVFISAPAGTPTGLQPSEQRQLTPVERSLAEALLLAWALLARAEVRRFICDQGPDNAHEWGAWLHAGVTR